MTALRAITTAAAAALLTTGCATGLSTSPDTPSTSSATPVTWVVEDGPSYSGPRGENGPGGTGEHYVTCVPDADLARDRADRDRWKEVIIPAEKAYTGEFDTGTPCPDGPVRLASNSSDQQ